jgi:FKBP-type peptidyl-prolyl cis-trans isomerase
MNCKYRPKTGKFISSCLTFFLMILVILPYLVQSQTESEPNDRRDQSNEIHLGETVEGFFQKKGDQDWYKLVVDKPGKNIIRIDLSAVPDVNVRLAFYNEKGNQLKDANFTQKGEPEEIVNLGVTEGIYYINAYGFEANDKDKYTLSTKLIALWEEGQEFEPNDRREQANDIRLDESITGLFQVKNDPDWYKLTVDQTGKNIVRIDLSSVSGVNSTLYLLDSRGRRIKSSDMRGEGEAEEIINFGVTEGVYYISVSASKENADERYTLSTKLIGPWEEGQEFESNDDRNRANEIKLDSMIEGHIQPKDDRDYYLITIPEPGMDLFVV